MRNHTLTRRTETDAVQTIGKALGKGPITRLLAAILGVLLFAAPPQASAGTIQLTSFTATPGDGRIALKWSVSDAHPGIDIFYHYQLWDTQAKADSGALESLANEHDYIGLQNGVEYKIEGWACQTYSTGWQEVQDCSSKTTVYATPTDE